MQKITLQLDIREYNALAALALKQRRPLQYQAEFILREELERCGLLQASSNTPGTQYISGDHPRTQEAQPT